MSAEPPAQGGIQTLGTIVVHCVVTNWNDMEKIQHHSFHNELRVTPEGHPVLPTEALLNPEADGESAWRRPSCEKLNIPATYVATQAACVYSFTTTSERAIARDFKENLTYIGLDHDTEHKSMAEFDKKKTYGLLDRDIISVGAGRFHRIKNSITVTPNISEAWKCCSSQVSLAKKPVVSTTLHPRAS